MIVPGLRCRGHYVDIGPSGVTVTLFKVLAQTASAPLVQEYTGRTTVKSLVGADWTTGQLESDTHLEGLRHNCRPIS